MPAVEEEKAVQGATMEISVSRQDLLRELTATQSVVERKTTIPILSNFLLEADADRIVITATDLDQSIRTSCAAKVKKSGSCTIPARKLYDYIRLLGDGDTCHLRGGPRYLPADFGRLTPVTCRKRRWHICPIC
jgi:DNA polymerase-3 subunit beta